MKVSHNLSRRSFLSSAATAARAGAVAAVAVQTKCASHDVPWGEGRVAIEKARRQA